MMSKSTPDASPAYNGISSSVICHEPRLSVIGWTGVEDLQSKIQFMVQMILLDCNYIKAIYKTYNIKLPQYRGFGPRKTSRRWKKVYRK